MASHLKGVKKTTMTDEIRRALCKHNKDNPSLTQKQLQEWVHSNYGLQVSQATISNTVKRSLEYLSLAPERGDVKRHKPAKFPDLENLSMNGFFNISMDYGCSCKYNCELLSSL